MGLDNKAPSSSAELWQRLSTAESLFVIAGPCVIESEELCLRVADHMQVLCDRLAIPYIFKASFDKANRTAAHSYRGPGLEEGLACLARVRDKLGVPVLSDVHSENQVDQAAEVVDVLQIPAFLCRQTDLIQSAARSNVIVNLKKGQFLSPEEMGQVVKKVEAAGGQRILLTERGVSFGYNDLVSDMRALPILRRCGYPVVFDATHSVQTPGAAGDHSGGNREFAPVLARAAVAAGADGLFLETHPTPERALSDGANSLALEDVAALLEQAVAIHRVLRA